MGATRRGFTLIELLIVVAIIAILAAIAVPNFLEAQTRSKISRCRTDLRTLAGAWEAYRLDYNRYPPDFDGGEYGGAAPYQGEWRTYIVVTTPVAYLTSVPTDVFQEGAQLWLIIKPGKLYEYWGTLGNMAYPEWQATNTLWIIIGYGPDQDYDLSGTQIAAPFNYMYDPTNGTKSNGDMARSNSHSYPE
ncbi:MAG TPA: prepilin-type N-terminal cleavage/methylation domain-containing protein [Sumerlaeia bacterium]|nr:prepilin-type N-terminal cleavage/methylation domain-containing protein [Sumerlaeia bacterium]